MFSCCCAETTSPPEVVVDERPEEVQVPSGSPKAAVAAPQGAAAAAPAIEKPASPQAAAAVPESSTVGTARKVFVSPTKKEEAPAKKPMTAPTVERARRTSVPLEAPIEEGVFLMYDSTSETIYAQWSNTPQASALAWLKPLVAVPGHKFKVNGGKQILYNKALEQNKYYQGWVKFITIANEFPSKLMLLDNFGATGAPDIQFLQLISGPVGSGESECVTETFSEYNKLYDLKNVKAVAVVPLTSHLIEVGKPVTPQKFLQMGKGEGDAIAIQIKKV